MYKYATVQSFLCALRYLVSVQGIRDFQPYYDEEDGLVGLKYRNHIYLIPISTIRHHYNVRWKGKEAPMEEAKMFAKDVEQILGTRNHHAN